MDPHQVSHGHIEVSLSQLGDQLLVAKERVAVLCDDPRVEGEEHAEGGEAQHPVGVDVEAGRDPILLGRDGRAQYDLWR